MSWRGRITKQVVVLLRKRVSCEPERQREAVELLRVSPSWTLTRWPRNRYFETT